MAIDEAMWHLVGEGLYSGVVRTYGWTDAPVVSLGYFQDASWLERDERLCKLPFVRRPTGGGAILHGQQMTFACAVRRDVIAGPAARFARAVHESIAAELARAGVFIRFGGDSACADRHALLCFERPDSLAGYVDGKRVLGSAQRRSRTALLLHGVLGPLPGLSEEATAAALERALVGIMHCCPLVRPVRLPIAIEDKASWLRDAKYAQPDWNLNRRCRGGRAVAGEGRRVADAYESGDCHCGHGRK